MATQSLQLRRDTDVEDGDLNPLLYPKSNTIYEKRRYEDLGVEMEYILTVLDYSDGFR